MNAYALIASLAWTASAVLCISRADVIAHRWMDGRSADAPNAPVVIPDDLIGFAMLESEKWAQDATLKVIRERSDELKDWNQVRMAMGLAAVDA
jgi:hypothetical protein